MIPAWSDPTEGEDEIQDFGLARQTNLGSNTSSTTRVSAPWPDPMWGDTA